MSRSRRTIVVASAAVACACLAAGALAASHIKSPAQAAAEAKPPAASPITARVDRRLLTSRLITRGDAAFAGTVDVRVETGGMTLPPVITGRLPEPGAGVTEGMVLLEVAGRPVIVLGGDLPTYRSLRPGLSGPDVRQLEQALDRLGHDPGRTDGRYDSATARAVSALFRKAGYEPPEMAEDDENRLRTARQRIRDARAGVTAAEQALAEAAAGPGGSAREEAAVATAREDVAAAESELAEAERAAGTPLPAAEVVFLSGLPRRVDEVRARTGALVDGPVMTVSGADLVVTAGVTTVQRQLLTEGMAGRLELGSLEVDAAVTAIRRRAASASEEEADAGEFEVALTPSGLNTEQVTLLRGANVRVVIPISGTDGPVLAVPAAALSAGPDGRSRVEILRPAGTTELVVVDVGLSADGYAEIRPVDGSVVEGDQMVIGR